MSVRNKQLVPGQFVWISHPDWPGNLFPTLMEKVVERRSESGGDIEYLLVGPDGTERTLYSYFIEPLNAVELMAGLPETMFHPGKNILHEGRYFSDRLLKE